MPPIPSTEWNAAIAMLRAIWARPAIEDLELHAAPVAGAQVRRRYQPIFARPNLPRLTEEQFRGFLNFKNNQHWHYLDRLGSAICRDMHRLRGAIDLLLDDAKPTRERLNQLRPTAGPPYVPRLGKAVLTPILLVMYPEQCGVWNQVSEDAMKRMRIWPHLQPDDGFGDQYDRVNAILVQASRELALDLWTLDALWARVEADAGQHRLLLR